MLDEPGQEPTPQTPAPGAPVPPAAPTPPVEPAKPDATPTAPAAEPKTFDEAYVKTLRDEAAAARVAKKALEDRLTAVEREKLSDQEKVVLDLKKLQDETLPGLTRENQQLRVQVAAGKLGIVDPEAASLLLDWNAVNAGTPVEDALTALLAAKPWLKGAQATTPPPAAPVAPASTSSPANPGAAGAAPPSFTRSDLAKMSPDQYEAQQAAINQALREGRVDFTR